MCTPQVFIHSRKGIAQLNQYGDFGQMYLNMSNTESESMFADTWGQALKATLINSRSIGVLFADASTVTIAMGAAMSRHLSAPHYIFHYCFYVQNLTGASK